MNIFLFNYFEFYYDMLCSSLLVLIFFLYGASWCLQLKLYAMFDVMIRKHTNGLHCSSIFSLSCLAVRLLFKGKFKLQRYFYRYTVLW